jgi:ADP-heptose:LPS heptosyltransferase
MEKILAIQLKRIGDLVLTRHALALLRRRWPTAEIAVAVDSITAPVVSVLGLNLRPISFRRNAMNLAALSGVMTHGWDAVLDFTGTDRSALVATVSRGKMRIGYFREKLPLWQQFAANRRVNVPVRDFHTSEYYARLLKPLGERDPGELDAPPLQIPDAARESAAAKLTALGIPSGSRFAVIHPGSAREEKYWAPERWARVAAHLVEQGFPVVMTGGTAAFEVAHAQQIASRCKVHSLVGKLSLVEMIATLAQAELILSCDTAVVHFASALKRPQVALFGPTNPFHWRPMHPAGRVISASAPESALEHFSARMRGAPMDQIKADAVIEVADSLLASTAPVR